MYNLAELSRRFECIAVLAVIQELDEANRRLRVLIDDDDEEQVSAWLPWPTDIGRNYVRWRPLRRGTHVLLACPSGNLANAQVVGQTYSQQIPSPAAEPGIDLIAFEDGTRLKYNSDNSTLTVDAVGDVTIKSATQIEVAAPTVAINANNLNIVAAVSIDGAVTQTGGDITSDRIGLQAHKHTEQGDGAQTSPAQS